jgi:hypothetical protein
VGLSLGAQEDVGGLEVAVQDAPLVGVVDGPGHRRHQPRRPLGVVGEARQVPVQAAAVDQLHAVEPLPVRLADLVDRHDGRVFELGRGLGLHAEAPQIDRARAQPRVDHLEGDDAVQALLPRPVDDPHPALGDSPQQLVVAQHACRPLGAFPAAVGGATGGGGLPGGVRAGVARDGQRARRVDIGGVIKFLGHGALGSLGRMARRRAGQV